jgi:hypothetical protein
MISSLIITSWRDKRLFKCKYLLFLHENDYKKILLQSVSTRYININLKTNVLLAMIFKNTKILVNEIKITFIK